MNDQKGIMLVLFSRDALLKESLMLPMSVRLSHCCWHLWMSIYLRTLT